MTAGAVASSALGPISTLSLRQRLRRLRIGLVYWWRHGSWPNLDVPKRFTEWVQWRKLNASSEYLSLLTDKLHSKQVADERAGAPICVPTIWAGTEMPTDPPAPFPLIVKANHGCNQFAIVRDPADWARALERSRGWLESTYGDWLDEGAYRSARAMILIEPFIGGRDGTPPDDYKVYVFGGRAAIVQHHVGRGKRHRWTQYDRSWQRVGGSGPVADAPSCLEAMLETAEKLSAGHDFLRVDFYAVGGELRFGEFCLYPGSGLDPFNPRSLDDELGNLWSAARSI